MLSADSDTATRWATAELPRSCRREGRDEDDADAVPACRAARQWRCAAVELLRLALTQEAVSYTHLTPPTSELG